jgi:hypothetical protein
MPWSCRSDRCHRARGRNTSQATPRLPIRSLLIRLSSVRCQSVRVPTPWSCRRAQGRNTSQATPRLPIRSSSDAVELPIRPWSYRQARGPAWPCGVVAGRRIFGRKDDDSVFLLTLTFLCFFCFMLICQVAIGGQKGGGFCHNRIEVISFGK